jgi:hypothetical protein
MLKKIKKESDGPGWSEVILGAALALILGVVLGAALLVTKTVTKVTSIPKDAPAGAVYFIEGQKDMSNLGANEKRKTFVGGESVDVTEGELNAFAASIAKARGAPPPAPKPGDKTPAPAAPDAKILEEAPLNVRIHDGKITFADTVTLNVLGITEAVVVQATGTFTRGGSGFEFEPETVYVGGCPVQRLLFVRGWIMKKLLFTEPVPDDVAAAWSKLVDVSIDGSKLRLRAP